MDEAKLLEKLRLLEALYAGATTEGERAAAAAARQRILLRLERLGWSPPPPESPSARVQEWSRRVYLAVCRRYGVDPERLRAQWRTAVVEKVSRRIEVWTKRGGAGPGR